MEHHLAFHPGGRRLVAFTRWQARVCDAETNSVEKIRPRHSVRGEFANLRSLCVPPAEREHARNLVRLERQREVRARRVID